MIYFMPVLLLLLTCGAAYGRTFDGCTAAGVRVQTVYDAVASGPASAADGRIVINPYKMRLFSPGHQKFIYWHECGHVALRHQGATASQEGDADCFALWALRTKEHLSHWEIERVVREVSELPGDQTHLTGPARAAHLRRCGSGGSGFRTGQERRRRY